jgi:hypothetical protein
MRTGILFMAWTLLLSPVLVSTGLAQQDYVATAVGRIEYGNQDSQVGVFWGAKGADPESTRGLTVDATGNIYLGDPLNGKVKEFSGRLQLLALTEGTIQNLQSFAVDPSGNIYVYEGTADSRLTKFGQDGRRIWSHPFQEILPDSDLTTAEKEFNTDIFSLLGAGISRAPSGGVIAELIGWDLTTGKSKSLGLQLDSDGRLVQILPDFRISGGTLWWSYEASMVDDQPPPSVVVKAYSDTGALVKTISLETEADGGIHFSGVRTGVYTVLPDQHGGVFVVTYVTALQPIYLTPTVKIGTDVVLNRFDGDGRFLEEWRLPAKPFGGGLEIAVAPDGSLYHLRFDQAGVDVVAYRCLTQTTAKGPGVNLAGLSGRRVYELVSYRSGNSTLVSLRALAQSLGYRVTWNSKNGIAELARAGSRMLFRTDRNIVLANGRETRLRGRITLKQGRVWVPASEVASVLSLPLKLDRQHQIAFLVLP